MVFGVGQINYDSYIWLGHILVAMATKICDFQHKIGYNLACASDTSRRLHLLGIFGIGQFNAVSQTLLRRPLFHGNEKLGILPENLP